MKATGHPDFPLEYQLAFWDDHKKLRWVHFIPEYARLTGDVHSAILLCQLLFWFKPTSDGKSKLTIERDGKEWLAKSWDLLREETALTERQLRAGLRLLKDRGVLLTTVYQFKGAPTTHLHLDVACLYEWICTPSSESIRTPSSECISEAYSTAKTTAVLACEDPHAKTPTFDHLSKSLQEEDQGSAKVIQMPTAKDILEKIKTAKQENKITGGKQGVHWLAMRWKQKLALLSDEFVKGLTQQEVGQLKAFMVAVGGVQIAKEIIDFILPMWGEFAFEAKASYGLSTAPDKPVVGFLLKYHDVAVQLSAKSKQVLVHHIPTQPVAKPPHPPQLDQPEETVTKDAVLAALAKLKGG
jgi:hypothetical protein